MELAKTVAKRVPTNKQIAQKLEQMGFLEKHGKTNAIYYILPRRYYELAGDVAAYSLAQIGTSIRYGLS